MLLSAQWAILMSPLQMSNMQQRSHNGLYLFGDS